jgi:hypothetical protein
MPKIKGVKTDATSADNRCQEPFFASDSTGALNQWRAMPLNVNLIQVRNQTGQPAQELRAAINSAASRFKTIVHSPKTPQ